MLRWKTCSGPSICPLATNLRRVQATGGGSARATLPVLDLPASRKAKPRCTWPTSHRSSGCRQQVICLTSAQAAALHLACRPARVGIMGRVEHAAHLVEDVARIIVPAWIDDISFITRRDGRNRQEIVRNSCLKGECEGSVSHVCAGSRRCSRASAAGSRRAASADRQYGIRAPHS